MREEQYKALREADYFLELVMEKLSYGDDEIDASELYALVRAVREKIQIVEDE